MSTLIPILAAVLAIFAVILFHELGHFTVAKLMGVKVEKFSIGFGKAIWSYTSRGGTEYAISILPLGGYVKMLGEASEVKEGEDPSEAYSSKSVGARIAIVLAGPIANFILATILFWAVFLAGVVHVKPIVGHVIVNSISAKAGLKAGDEIRQIDSIRTPNWQRVLMALITRLGNHGQMKVEVKPQKSDAIQTYVLELKTWQVGALSPNLFKSLGFLPWQPKIPPVIAKIMPGTPAAFSGMQVEDKIIKFNNKPVDDWIEIVKWVRSHPGKMVSLQVRRADKLVGLQMRIGRRQHKGKAYGFLGVEAKIPPLPKSMIWRSQYNALSAWLPALEQTWTLTYFNYVVLGKMIFGKLSLRTLGGPISIFQTAGRASSTGLITYLGFVAFVSITLGFINLLPIPGLDGGHFVFHLIEAAAGKPIPQRVQIMTIKIGILLIVTLMIFATMNDLLRLF